LEQLSGEFMKLSGQIANATLASLLEQYPAIKNRSLNNS